MSRPRDQGTHQDYIASSRYRNDLPAPEMPPKNMEIEHDGVSHFVAPGYATNMARKEDLNIDMDAEGGMSLNMVGIPGYHLGDESAITAPDVQPLLDHGDLILLQTPAQLRQGAPKSANVSFLRRTQYIAPTAAQKLDIGSRNPALRPKPRPANAQSDTINKADRNDPTYIKKYIQKGFDIAYPESKHTGEDEGDRLRGLNATKQEIDAWNKPVHPTNPQLKLVDSYPILPDLDAFTDTGGQMMVKFEKPPVAPLPGNRRDERMDVAILLPIPPSDKVAAAHASKKALHKNNPSQHPDPGPIPYDYNLYLPDINKKDSAAKIQAKFNPENPHKNDPTLYTHTDPKTGKPHDRYDFVRRYVTSQQVLLQDSRPTDIALTLVDPFSSSSSGDSRHNQKGAFYTRIIAKTKVKPERSRMMAGGAALANDEDMIGQLQIEVRDPNEDEVSKRANHRAAVDSKFRGFWEGVQESERGKNGGDLVDQDDEAEEGGEGDAEGDADADGDADMDDE